MKIDKKDIKLLYELINDSSQTDTLLGTKLELSGVSIRNRINKLVKNGVIEKFVPQYQGEPFGMSSIYLVALEKNYKDLLKKAKILGKPSHIIHCVGSIVVLGIIVKDSYEEKQEFANQLINEGKAISVSTSKTPGFNKIITKTELKILQSLIPDTQISNDNLASMTGFSKKTVSRSLQNLKDNNILFSTIIWNPKKIENYVTFYLEISIQNKIEQTVKKISKKFSKSFLASPMIFDNEVALTMFANNVHEMDDIAEEIKEIENTSRVNVFIPKKIELIYDWFIEFVSESERGPLHISKKSKHARNRFL